MYTDMLQGYVMYKDSYVYGYVMYKEMLCISI